MLNIARSTQSANVIKLYGAVPYLPTAEYHAVFGKPLLLTISNYTHLLVTAKRMTNVEVKLICSPLLIVEVE